MVLWYVKPTINPRHYGDGSYVGIVRVIMYCVIVLWPKWMCRGERVRKIRGGLVQEAIRTTHGSLCEIT